MRPTSSTSSSSVKRAVRAVVFVVVAGLMLAALQFALFPRHDRDELWTDYRALPNGSVDVLLLGTSLVHANVNPAVVWDETGVRAYDLSGSSQSLLTTRPYLEQALRSQSPQLVVLDIHMLSMPNEPLSEMQKRTNLTMMPFGLPKLRAIADAAPASEWTRYLLPLEQFHSRWGELQRRDFSPNKWRRNADNLYLGYRKVDKAAPQERSTDRRTFDEALYDRNYAIVSDIIATAQASGARVLLVIGPSTRPVLHEAWVPRLQADLKRRYPGVELLDTASRVAEMGIDYERDYYDLWHLNSKGAEKYSRWFGRKLVSDGTVSPKGNDRLDEPWRLEWKRYREATAE